MMVPFIDLRTQYLSIRREIDAALAKVFEQSSFSLGREVELFEKEFADYCGVRYCLGLNSGTSALHLALLACGIGRGEEVLLQPNTFFATAEAISYIGAMPRFVDVDSATYNLDTARLEKHITKKTKCILPVHLYGNPSPIKEILLIAKKHNLLVIEDVAQAHGVKFKGRHLGTFGKAGCFSFYPAKVLGACGEAGAVITNDKKIYLKMKALRDHGQVQKHNHQFIGYNYRMDGFQGAILRVKLKKLNNWIKERRKKAKLYNKLLKDFVIVPSEEYLSISNVQYYVIRARLRDKLQRYLAKKGITTQVHYPVPIHLQNAYKFLGYKKGDFPVAERLSKEILSLPLYPEITERKVQYIAREIKRFYGRKI